MLSNYLFFLQKQAIEILIPYILNDLQEENSANVKEICFSGIVTNDKYTKTKE